MVFFLFVFDTQMAMGRNSVVRMVGAMVEGAIARRPNEVRAWSLVSFLSARHVNDLVDGL